MIQVTPQTRILVAVEVVDFRNGIDGLARVCQEQLHAHPVMPGACFQGLPSEVPVLVSKPFTKSA
jgi:hypothetical protein